MFAVYSLIFFFDLFRFRLVWMGLTDISLSCAVSSLDLGPGTSVLMLGPAGSPRQEFVAAVAACV